MGLEIVQLWKKYRGGTTALQDVSLSLESGVLAVLGPAGAGKSTLGAIVATLEPPSRGTATVDGLDIWKKRPEVRRRIGYAPQDAALFDQLTVTETLDYLALIQGMDHPPARRIRVARALDRFELLDQAQTPVHSLSPGANRRLLLAQAALGQPGLLIFDGPTYGIEPDEAARIRTLIGDLGRECAVLLLTEDVNDLAVANSVLVLHQGRVRYTGTPEGLAAQVDGRAWSLDVLAGDVRPAPNVWVFSGIERIPGGWRLRGVADQPPSDQAERAVPRAEDGYAWLLTRRNDEANS